MTEPITSTQRKAPVCYYNALKSKAHSLVLITAIWMGNIEWILVRQCDDVMTNKYDND